MMGMRSLHSGSSGNHAFATGIGLVSQVAARLLSAEFTQQEESDSIHL